MRNSMRLTCGFLVFALAAFVAACSDQGGSTTETGSPSSSTAAPAGGNAELKKLTLQLNWVPEPQFGGFYEAAMNGHFKEQGYDVEVQRGIGGDPTIQMVANGTVDYAIAEAEQVILARASGIPVVAVYAAFQTSPRAIMVHKSKGYTTLADIFADSSTILAMETGSNYGNFLKSKYGFDNVDIQPNAGAMERFIEDENFAMQCFATSEPLEAANRGSDPQVFTVAEAGYNPYMTVVVVSEDKLKNNAEEVRKVVSAIRAGWAGYVKDPTKTNAEMRKMNDGMAAATFKAAAEAQLPLVMPESGEADLGKMTPERWTTLIKQLIDLNVVSASTAPTAAACFTNPAPLAANMANPQAATTQPAE
jgi:NitT/TauT family transport system substrate-binding protein